MCFAQPYARDFWITAIAFSRYMPRAFRVKQVDGNQFFTEEKRQEYRRRMESVTPSSQRQWGTMELIRCSFGARFEGRRVLDLPDESYLISRTLSNGLSW